MTCPYCPRIEKIMKEDQILDPTLEFFSELLEKIPKFILRNGAALKEIIEDFLNKNNIKKVD